MRDISIRFKLPFYIVILATAIFSATGTIMLKHLYDIREEEFKRELISLAQLIYATKGADTTFSLQELELPYSVYLLGEREGFLRVVDSYNPNPRGPNELLFQFTFRGEEPFGLLPQSEALRIFGSPFSAYARVMSGKGIVVIAVPFDMINRFTKNIKRDFILLYCLAILSTLIVSIVIADSFSKRLSTVGSVAEALSQGKIEKRVVSPGGDEIGVIGQNLNAFADLAWEINKHNDDLMRAFNCIEVPMAIVSGDGCIIEANLAFENHFGTRKGKCYEILEQTQNADQSSILRALKVREKKEIVRYAPKSGKKFIIKFLPLENELKGGLLYGVEENVPKDDLGIIGISAQAIIKKISSSLGIIEGFARELLASEKKGEEKHKLESLLKHSLLIRQTLESVSAYASVPLPSPEKFSIAEEVSSVVSTIPEGARLKITVEIPENLNVVADKSLFKEALGILLDNALTATKKSGEIFIRATEDDKNVIITVADTGTGVDSADLAEIRKPLYSTWERPGLGLARVEKIMGAHAGILDIISSKGNGFQAKLIFRKPET